MLLTGGSSCHSVTSLPHAKGFHGTSEWKSEEKVVVFACQEWTQAVWILAACQRKNLQPHVVAYNTAISACERQWEVALLLFWEMLGHEEPDLITYNAMISTCAAGLWQQALGLLDRAKEQLVQVDVMSLDVIRCHTCHFIFGFAVFLCFESVLHPSQNMQS